MRKFKFTGDSSTYNKGLVKEGNIYTEGNWEKSSSIFWYIERFPKDWEEVFENQSHWISVSDKLPKIETPVLVFSQNIIFIGWINKDSFFEIESNTNNFWDYPIKYWMPLPEPPVK